jgi:hypothetical protein
MFGRGTRAKRREDSVRRKASERLSRVPEGELLVWTESAVVAFHRGLDEHRRHREGGTVAELREAVSMIAGAVDVLEQRYQV